MKLRINQHHWWGISLLLCLALLLSLHHSGSGESACCTSAYSVGQVVNASHSQHPILFAQSAPPLATFLSHQNSHRFGSSRPAKTLVTHGVKPIRGQGRLARSEYANPHRHIYLSWQGWHVLPLLGSAPPCHYYVFALRRILR